MLESETYLEFSQDVLGHIIFSNRIDHEALVAHGTVRGPVLMAFFLKHKTKLEIVRIYVECTRNVFTLTLPISFNLVSITMMVELCSHSIRQKSSVVSGSGPCVAM